MLSHVSSRLQQFCLTGFVLQSCSCVGALCVSLTTDGQAESRWQLLSGSVRSVGEDTLRLPGLGCTGSAKACLDLDKQEAAELPILRFAGLAG
jgi:hypothetical protein